MLMIIEVWIMPIIFIFAPEVSHPKQRSRRVDICFGRNAGRVGSSWDGSYLEHGLRPRPFMAFFMAKKNGGDPKYLLSGMIIQVGLMVIGSVS